MSAGATVPPGRTPRSRVDGRSARAERTRRAMVDALLGLIAEGDLKASPERIVERAGVSLRTLWTNFKDLEGLYAAGEVAGFGGGGVHGYNALEGTFLGGCIHSGLRAGRALGKSVG